MNGNFPWQGKCSILLREPGWFQRRRKGAFKFWSVFLHKVHFITVSYKMKLYVYV